jgi:hypothetical protein
VEAQIRLVEDMHTEGVHFGRRSLFKKLRAAGWLWLGMSNQIKKVVRYESKGTIEKVLLECVKALEVKK